MQTIKLEFKVDRSTWLGLDAEKEQIDLGKLIDDVLRRHGLGKWSGSAQKGTSLIIFCMVSDEAAARGALLENLTGHPLIGFLKPESGDPE